ncbi:iron-sulfur cluster repair di-iron protein [Labilibaculum euxinus]|uniref:Iron-sulfur cluster repair di-iron protein n=1 Tax=Labilibaculum euxinus TaxID=2686357 RepID=A0A7M4DBI8_9BACT|nr:iron-sulfur cluster repair di-iron protein [Labilibaculum euxinus]MUP40017.1 iron-sulfur cluster repair di-iron protein [Labilibaculum euxinus]MVB09222.1 iron-sulfur cluster repair di-iron protein [Labilibaculum euxinus]
MINQETSVGDIVKNHFQTVKIFDDHQIDFCCGGKQSLSEACAKKSIDTDQIITQLEKAIKIPAAAPKFNEMPLDKLIQYIKEKHHTYIREQIPMLSKFLNKIEQIHGSKHPEIEMVNAHFKESVKQLTEHMGKEETELFPLIEKLSKLKNGEQSDSSSLKITVEKYISLLVQEHENEGARFEEISRLTLNYQPPKGTCNTFCAAYENLLAFEKDLHRHVHLENNILFPKAIKLEQDVRKID